jgi:hypothetical protein
LHNTELELEAETVAGGELAMLIYIGGKFMHHPLAFNV